MITSEELSFTCISRHQTLFSHANKPSDMENKIISTFATQFEQKDCLSFISLCHSFVRLFVFGRFSFSVRTFHKTKQK